MNGIKSKEPLVESGKKYWEASRMRITLKNFYKKKRHSYMENFPDFHDSNLKEIFVFSESTEQSLDKKKQGNVSCYYYKKDIKKIF